MDDRRLYYRLDYFYSLNLLLGDCVAVPLLISYCYTEVDSGVCFIILNLPASQFSTIQYLRSNLQPLFVSFTALRQEIIGPALNITWMIIIFDPINRKNIFCIEKFF